MVLFIFFSRPAKGSPVRQECRETKARLIVIPSCTSDIGVTIHTATPLMLSAVKVGLESPCDVVHV